MAPHLFVALYDGDLVGFGGSVLSGQQEAFDAVAALYRCRRSIESIDVHALDNSVQSLEEQIQLPVSVLSALEMAMYDLHGISIQQTVSRVLGLPEGSLPPTAITLSLSGNEECLAAAATLAAWPILKLKVGPQTDINLPCLLRSSYGGRIWIDGNGSWDVNGALRAIEAFARAGVELLEQPIIRGYPEQLRFIQERSPIRIVADEDFRDQQDVSRLGGCVKVVNVKLFKCGGLRRALKAIHAAHGAGLQVMLGCKTESVLNVSAMAHLGVLAEYLDLDGHLDIEDDPFDGIRVTQGNLECRNSPGLGVVRLGGPLQAP